MLTDAHLRKAKPRDRAYKLPDSGGLHLHVSTTGTRSWRWRYDFGGREQTLTIGRYPEIGLADARVARDEAKRVRRGGQDPAVVLRARKLDAGRKEGETFERVAREWHALQAAGWSEVHAADVLRSLERDVFPRIGSMAIRDAGSHTGAPTILEVLRAIEAREARETAHRVRQRISDVFVFAIASSRCEADPAAIVKKALAPVVRGRQPAVEDLASARKILEDAESTPASPITKLALRLLALTVVRPGTLATTPWAELAPTLEEDEPTWQVPAARMKLRRELKTMAARDHLVPLSRQAIEAIEAVRTLTRRSPYVFPNGRGFRRPMSENALGYLLNRAGYHQRHVPHGWRATFSTIMNERHPHDRKIIDLMLGHVPENKVEAAYNRAAYLDRRRALAQIWADLLMEGKPSAAAIAELPRR